MKNVNEALNLYIYIFNKKLKKTIFIKIHAERRREKREKKEEEEKRERKKKNKFKKNIYIIIL